jgi:hypothetical protein
VSARVCAAHISLSDTLKAPITDEQMDELRQVTSVMQPFVIEYGPLQTYPPHPGVCFDIKPVDKFFALREAIHSTSPFSGNPLERRNILPHLTIAEFGLTFEASETFCEKLASNAPSGNWECKGVSLAIPNRSFHFEEVAYLNFQS